MALIIDHDAVRRTLNWSDAIDLLEEMSRHEAAGRTFVSPKFNSDFETGSMRILFAADHDAGYGATKAYHTIDGIGSRYLVSLIDIATGELLAIVDGRRITDLRTGAASGVVARKMGFDRPVSVGIIGSGHQARAQLESLAAVCDIDGAAVFSPTRNNREAFAAELGDRLGIDIDAVGTAEAAARGRDIVAAASKSRSAEPVLLGEWLEGCRLLCAVGNTRPRFNEIDNRCFADAGLVIVDSRHAFDEAGELIQAVASGALGASKWTTLAEMAGDAVPPEGLVIFKSVGTALQDLALAGRCYERLRDQDDVPVIPDLDCSGS